jgi:hypothetical protein
MPDRLAGRLDAGPRPPATLHGSGYRQQGRAGDQSCHRPGQDRGLLGGSGHRLVEGLGPAAPTPSAADRCRDGLKPADRGAHLSTDPLPPPDPNRQGNRGGASSDPRVGASQLPGRYQAIVGHRRLGDWLIDPPECWRDSGGGDRRRFGGRRLGQGTAAGRQHGFGGRRWLLSRHLGLPSSHLGGAGRHRLLRRLGLASCQGRFGGLGFAGGEAGWRVGPGVGDPVVAVQLPLLVLRQLLVGRHRRRPLDQGLGEGDPDGVAFLAGADQGNEGSVGAGGAGLEQGPLWLAGDLVQVDDLDGAERLAVVVDKGAALPAVGHVWSRKRHGYLQLKAGGAVLNGVGPRPDAVDWRSYRRWLTIRPSRKPVISAKDRFPVRRRRGCAGLRGRLPGRGSSRSREPGPGAAAVATHGAGRVAAMAVSK